MALRALTAKVAPGTTVELEARLTCVCPVNARQDHATVRVRYQPSQKLIELGSFREYLDVFAKVELLHEDVTQIIKRDVEMRTGVAALITTDWEPVEGVTCKVTA